MNPVLEAKNIELIVNGRELPVLAKTDLSILPGEFVIVLGHNGSGKSSLVKILSGDKNPTSGLILVNQKKLSEINDKAKAKDIITITQNPQDRLFLELTIEENIILWEDRYNASLQNLITPLNLPKNSVVVNLSGGGKQAFLLSLVLTHPPSILLLDEHTSALDPKGSMDIMSKTAKAVLTHKITTIMVTHRLDDALKYGDRLIIMKEGVIIKDIYKSRYLSVEEIKAMM